MNKELILFYPGELYRRGNSLSFETYRGRKDFPVKEIGSVFCFAQISFVSRVFDFLGNNGIPVFFFSYYGFLRGVFVPFNNDLSSNKECFKITQVKCFLNKDVRLEIAKEFLVSAVENMVYLLENYNVDENLIKNFEVYKDYLSKSKDISELMLREANMRFNYYKLFGNLIKNKDFDFVNRNYRPPKDPINAIISFGNTLLYSFVLAEIFKTDADPKISFLHSPQDNRFSLNLDISEIFKPIIVDRFILQIVNKRILKVDEHFDLNKDGSCYLNKEGKKIFLKHFLNFLDQTTKHKLLGRKVSFKYLIRLEVYKLIKCIRGWEKYVGFRLMEGY